jgi:hypothetical protein
MKVNLRKKIVTFLRTVIQDHHIFQHHQDRQIFQNHLDLQILWDNKILPDLRRLEDKDGTLKLT